MTGGRDGVDPKLQEAAKRREAAKRQEAAARGDSDRVQRIATGDPLHQLPDGAASDDAPTVPEGEEPGLIEAMRGM